MTSPVSYINNDFRTDALTMRLAHIFNLLEPFMMLSSIVSGCASRKIRIFMSRARMAVQVPFSVVFSSFLEGFFCCLFEHARSTRPGLVATVRSEFAPPLRFRRKTHDEMCRSRDSRRIYRQCQNGVATSTNRKSISSTDLFGLRRRVMQISEPLVLATATLSRCRCSIGSAFRLHGFNQKRLTSPRSGRSRQFPSGHELSVNS